MKRARSFATWFGAVGLLVGLLPLGLQHAAAYPAAAAAPPSQTNSGAVRRDVTYCTGGGVELKMDIYMPQTAPAGPSPAVLYVHGGSWVSGDKFEVGLAAPELTRLGYLVASANYRLAPRHKWPAQIEDVKCAVRYLRANAAALNLDPNRIAAWGSSAGGHLVALLGLAGPSAGFEGQGGYPEQSSAVQAVVDMFGPTDLTAFDPDEYAVGVAEAVFNVRRGDPTDVLVKASPVSYVRRDAPPFLILQGDSDTLVPLSQSQALYDKLNAAGASAEMVIVKNAGHGFVPAGGTPSPSIVELRNIIARFLARTIGSPAPPSPGEARHFPETGKTVRGAFLQYWLKNGGLRQQGYPISDEMQARSEVDGKIYTMQYFERAVFELHPENPPPHNVLLSLLGLRRYSQKYPGGAPGQVPNSAPGSVLFPQTGKRLGGRFLQYWTTYGGLPQYGYPISDEFLERSEIDGRLYTVQYFERAVFELHPENPPPNDLLLSLLGALYYQERGKGQR